MIRDFFDNTPEWWGLIFVILFFSYCIYLVRRRVSYIFRSLPKYDGIYGRSVQIGTFHGIVSFILCGFNFAIISDYPPVKYIVEKDLFRISLFLFLWFFWILLTGLLIEKYLVKTDIEYRDWKKKYLERNNCEKIK
jgi:hypothetical protein